MTAPTVKSSNFITMAPHSVTVGIKTSFHSSGTVFPLRSCEVPVGGDGVAFAFLGVVE
jgi:hypothetical protein